MLKDIRDWEKEFTAQFPRIKLLGEIELSQDDFDALTGEISKLIKRSLNMPDATHRLTERYPHVMVTFLAHFAARNVNREFWDAVAERLETPGISFHSLKWHNHFVKILKDNHKNAFENVGGSTNKYVTSMRIHGGIPSYSLGDFFKNMILPSIEKEQYLGLKPNELLQALLQRTDVQLFTDSPVRNFFEYSGEIGLNFLAECVNMARAYKQDGEVPPDLDLPNYIPEIFTEFMEKQVEVETRLKSPRLLFDPEGEGLVVELPQQQISAKDLHGNEQALWLITWDGQEIPIQKRLRLAFAGPDIVSRADQQSIPVPVSRVRVAFGLQSDSELRILRHFPLHFLPEPNQPQLLAFSLPASGNFCPILRSPSRLPPKTLLLLHPVNAELKFDGQAEKRHECDKLTGAWRGWQADYWSLENAACLYLEQPGSDPAIFRISTPAEIPSLVDGRQYNTADPKNVPLYLGAPPHLRLPHRPGRRWNIRLESVWETQPANIHYEFQESELKIAGNALEIDLDTVLGAEPAGTFAISFSNRLDIEDEIRFRIWPRLQIDDLSEAIFPEEQTPRTPAPVKFNINLPSAASCAPLTVADDLQINGQYGFFTVTLPEVITRADLNLVLPGENDTDPVRVPIFIPIPRLQWRITLPSEESMEWTTVPLQRSVEAMLQTIRDTSQVSALIKMPGLETIVSRLQLVLVDPDNPSDIVIIPPERKLIGEDYLRYSINRAYDTLHDRRSVSVFAFNLRLWGSAGIQSSANILTLTRSLEISKFWIEDCGEMCYTLHWQEPAPLRNRRVFLYPSWQPWNDGQEFLIPDDSHGELPLGTMSLPPSDYEAYFYIAPYRGAPPRDSKPDVQPHHFQTVLPSDRLLELARNISAHPKNAFQFHFECACIYLSQGNISLRDQEITACVDCHEQARLKTLAFFYEWVGKQNEIEQKTLRYRMLTPDRLKELFAQTKPSDPLMQTYLQHAQDRTLSVPSAMVILENETNDPQLFLFCLRLLLECNEPKGVEYILTKLKTGGISDEYVRELLVEQLDFSLLQLSEKLSNPDAMRLFIELFARHSDPQAMAQALSSQALAQLSAQKQTNETIRLILTHLILRGEKNGIERIMALFQQGELRGDEVTDLLGCNPGFAYQTLSVMPNQPAHSIQMSELAQKFPTETGQTVITTYTASSHNPASHIVVSEQVSHAKELLSKGDKAGVHQALNLSQQGLLNREQLLDLFSVNPKLAHQTLLGNPKFQQYQSQVVDLARSYPSETGYIVPGMSIKTPGGWGIVEKIFRVHRARYDIAALDEVEILLHVSLHPQFYPEHAVIELGESRLVFSGGESIFQCLLCKEFITSKREIAHLHHTRTHIGMEESVREHKPIMPLYLPYQVQPAPITSTTEAEKHPRRDDESLWLASLPNKQLLRLLESSKLNSPMAQTCIHILLKKEQKDCLAFLFNQLQAGHLSESLVLDLLGGNPLFAYEFYDSQPPSKRPMALMNALQRKYPNEIS